MEVVDLLEEVNDKKSFLIFVKSLYAERLDDIELEKQNPSSPYEPTIKGWENTTLEAFLESAIAWADDSNFGEIKELEENLWYQFATFLYCGKIYE